MYILLYYIILMHSLFLDYIKNQGVNLFYLFVHYLFLYYAHYNISIHIVNKSLYFI